MADDSGNHRRREERRDMVFYLDVDLVDAGRASLVDLSSSGLRLLTEQAFEPGQTFQAVISARDLDCDFDEVTVSIEVAWCRIADRPGCWEVGCRLDGCGLDDSQDIEFLISEFSMAPYK